MRTDIIFGDVVERRERSWRKDREKGREKGRDQATITGKMKLIDTPLHSERNRNATAIISLL